MQECKLLEEYIKTIQRRKLDWALRIDVLFQRSECRPKAVLEDARELSLWRGGALYEKLSPCFWNVDLGTLKTSGCTARRCQNQNWKPDPVTPLSFSQNICHWKRKEQIILSVVISKGPLLCFLPLLLLPLGFSLLGTSAGGQTATGPHQALPLCPAHSSLSVRNCPKGSTQKTFTFFFNYPRGIRFYRCPVTIAKVHFLLSLI